MSDGAREARPSKDDVFRAKEREVCDASSGERLGPTWPMDLGEQVVGSKHEFPVNFPHNNMGDSQDAFVTPTLTGSKAFSLVTDGSEHSLNNGEPFKVAFAPDAPGVQHAVVQLRFVWRDGTAETRSIQITARARKLDAVPESHAGARDTHTQTQTTPKPKEPQAPDRNLTVDGQKNWLKVNKAYEKLIKEQKQGVTDVQNESLKFKPKPAERSVWEDIAELAFQLGTGAIGGMVAKFVASRVSKALVGAEQVAAAAKKGEEGIEAAEKAAVAARGSAVDERVANRDLVAQKVGNYAREDAAGHAAIAESQISTQMSAVVSGAFKTAASEIRAGAQNQTPNLKLGVDGEVELKEQHEKRPSKDEGIAFFSEQQSMINTLDSTGSDSLNSGIAEQLKAHPDVADNVMEGIAGGLNDAAADAKEEQADYTAAQFMTYLARTNLGTETVKTPDGPETVTDMTKQRAHGHSKTQSSDLATGVVQIECDYQRGGAVSVKDAHAHNVSYLIVNRLLDKPLAHSGIPIRISLYGGLFTITRDEAGRIRTNGSLDRNDLNGSEEQHIQEAERIFHVVLSKTLAAWGIPQIHTNDATQGPDPKKDSAKQ